MTLWIKSGGYAFLIRLDLIFSKSLWKEFQLLQILNNLSTKHSIKLILYEKDVKILKFKRSSVLVDLWYVWNVRFWLLIPEMNTPRKAMEWFSVVNLMLGYLLLKKTKNLMNLVPCQKQLECHQHIINLLNMQMGNNQRN